MIERATFHAGRYHLAQEQEMAVADRRERHEQTLKRFYAHSMDLVVEQGWQHPLFSEAPNVLQMGTATASTTKTFVDFVHDINSKAHITVADFSDYPLQQSQDEGLRCEPNVNFVRTDTTKLGFVDNTFDLIETDGLLQFLSPEQKTQAVAEWYRTLKPGGVVTTRDRFVSVNDAPKEWDTLNKIRKHFSQRFGVYSYPTTTEVMRYKFNAQGFSTLIENTQVIDPRMLLIHDIVAQKPKIIK
ncbi:MAG: methyltransferase domain-containing protein [Candidatus Levybacteria bacterium]|nr:methyltransferase domain-containing protein [Candidatus Levybacteria bacterium]